MDTKKVEYVKRAMSVKPHDNISPREFSLQNYISENQEAGLAYVFDGKPIGEQLSKFSPNVAKDASDLLKGIYPEGDELQAEVGAKFSFLMVKDQEAYVKTLLACTESKNANVRLRALRGLVGLSGVVHEVPPEMTNTEAVGYYESLFEGNFAKPYEVSDITKHFQNQQQAAEMPPISALALIAGADRPWVRKRLVGSSDPSVWFMANVSNFNTSPGNMFDGFLKLVNTEKVPTSQLKEFYSEMWQRPDFVNYMRTKEEVVLQEGCMGGNKHKDELKQFLSFSSLLDANSNLSYFDVLAREFTHYQPSYFSIAALKEHGLTDQQAEIRAAFMQKMDEEKEQRRAEAAARRLLGLTYPTAAITKDPTPIENIQVGKQGLLDRFWSSCQKVITDVQDRFATRGTLELDNNIIEAAGCQSWEEKDRMVNVLEDSLESANMVPRLIPDKEFMPEVELPETPSEVEPSSSVSSADEHSYDSEDGPPLEEREEPEGMVI